MRALDADSGRAAAGPLDGQVPTAAVARCHCGRPVGGGGGGGGGGGTQRSPGAVQPPNQGSFTLKIALPHRRYGTGYEVDISLPPPWSPSSSSSPSSPPASPTSAPLTAALPTRQPPLPSPPPSLPPPPLVDAVRRGDEGAALDILASGQYGDIDAADRRDGQDGSALFWAACRGMQKVVRELLNQGASLNFRSATGCTPLHAAADNDQPTLIRILLRAGADIRLRNYGGSTAAHLAAFRGHYQCLLILLRAGSDVNATDKAGKTVYIHGMLSGNKAVTDLLKDMRDRCLVSSSLVGGGGMPTETSSRASSLSSLTNTTVYEGMRQLHPELS